MTTAFIRLMYNCKLAVVL